MSDPTKTPLAPGVTAYPEQTANTLRFTLGIPKAFTIAGGKVFYLRSEGPRDKVGRLRVFSPTTGKDQLLIDPLTLSSEEHLSVEERARRERMRESSSGITAFTVDRTGERIAFALSGQLFVHAGGSTTQWATNGSIIDPRLSPDGGSVAYATTSGELRITDGVDDRALCTPDAPNVSWGVAEFVAAEEMNRFRGFWWSPDSQTLLVARVDESPVHTWYISDPAFPDREPRGVRYPAAGTPNAEVRLFTVEAATGNRSEVTWDREFEYLASVSWTSFGPALLHVLTRDQRRGQVLAIEGDRTRVLAEEEDSAWIELIGNSPSWGPGGQLVMTMDIDHTRHLAIDGRPVTPIGLQVEEILDVDRHGITFNATEEPTESHLWWYGWGGELERLTQTPGVHTGRAMEALLVRSSRTLDRYGAEVVVEFDGVGTPLASLAEEPLLQTRAEILSLGARQLRAALLLPLNHEPGTPLPLLIDSYGGPHFKKVVASRNAFAESQWFAEHGFAVLVVDGSGTPSRGPVWEREIHQDFATTVLQDQVDAIEALIALRPGLIDAQRIAIKGWSFGGYLSALAALRRPDIFRAAIAGAPVTDWSLYDTCYTERYLTPEVDSSGYRISTITGDTPEVKRPIMIIHGLVDDNVVVAHALRLSKHLLETGHPHRVLPLTGITHMPNQEDVARNMLTMMVEFLNESL